MNYLQKRLRKFILNASINNMVKAIYAGTFDPITTGHVDIIRRGLLFCDELVVAIGLNPNKKTMFSEQERIALIQNTVKDIPRVSVLSFDGLMVELAKNQGASILIRGIRSVSDFEYEINLANVNKVLLPTLETVFLPTSPELAVVSSSAVKEIARYGGNISKFVSPYVAEQLKSKFGFVKFGDPQK